MIQESLVILACMSNRGCYQTTNLYYDYNPQTKEMINKHKDHLARYAGPEAVVLAPFVLLATRGRGSFRLTKYFSLSLSKNDANLLIFKLDF